MTQAAELKQTSANADEAARSAELMTDLVEEEADATLYTFGDDSVLVIRGTQLMAYDDIAAALAAVRR